MYLSHTTNIWRAYGLALQGGFVVLLLVMLSVASFDIGPLEANFSMVPLIGLYLWPDRAGEGLSALLIFLLGISKDIISGGPIGLWASVYLLCYGVLNTAYYGRKDNWRGHWSRFFGWMVFVFLFFTFVGVAFMEGPTAYWVLVSQSVTALIVFPIVYLFLIIVPITELSVRRGYSV